MQTRSAIHFSSIARTTAAQMPIALTTARKAILTPNPTEPEKKAIAFAGSDHLTSGAAPGAAGLAVVLVTCGGESSAQWSAVVGCPGGARAPDVMRWF
jgi:hypothetical protein